ncbi:MAG TPA: O-succinylhomoserine sulfhydrylase [Hyphomonadaceae bacterium]|nr:O-succinylhomoserine sulfhydrylase [Hyphomonadaceae bacterium]HPI47419.1 O-succinylhomoserine sulfhydrylase [Hyphomonadaceae bacterium]
MTKETKAGKPKAWRPQTLMVRGGTTRSQYGETSEALYLNSGFVYDSPEQQSARMAGDEPGYIYSRYANPTVRMFEERLAQLEGAEDCRATASGMAAIHTMLVAPIKPGDRIVAPRQLFSSCVWILKNVMPKMGVEVTWVDGSDIADWERAMAKPCRFSIIETPSNPLLDAVDIRAVADLTHAAGGELIVDNVFASPILQKPLALGADWVVYSTTKHMDGQGRTLGGAILGKTKKIEDDLQQYYRHTGPSMSPFNAWVVLKGLETMDLRVRRMSDNARQIADRLATNNKITAVRYPGRSDHPHHNIHASQMEGGGSMLSISVKGGLDAAYAALNKLNLIDISNNLGDSKSLITHPATTTHRTLTDDERAAIGLDNTWLRLSVGLEDPEDIAEDLEQALG